MKTNDFIIPGIVMTVIIVFLIMIFNFSTEWGVGLGLLGFVIAYIIIKQSKRGV